MNSSYLPITAEGFRSGQPHSAAEVVSNQTSVSLAIQTLQSAVKEAESSVDALLSRLGPALRPSVQPQSPANGAGPNYPCDLAKAIADSSTKLQVIAMTIREHIDRLEI